jgi:hypothetical protein
MGLIKSAMYSGAAIYGIKQVSKIAQNQQNNRRDQYSQGQYSQRDQYYDSRDQYCNSQASHRGSIPSYDPQDRGQPMDFRDADESRHVEIPPRYEARDSKDGAQRLYLEDRTRNNGYMDDRVYGPRQYYGPPRRSWERPQQGYVEDEELASNASSQRGGGGSDMASQVMSMMGGGMGGGSDRGGRRGKRSGGLLSGLLEN